MASYGGRCRSFRGGPAGVPSDSAVDVIKGMAGSASRGMFLGILTAIEATGVKRETFSPSRGSH